MKSAEPLPTVLVVDDEVRSQEAMRRTLDEDYNVLTASDADEAREKMERFEVSVILCDHLLATVRNAVEAQALQRDTNRLHLELRSSTPVLRQRAAGNLARARSIFDFDRIERAPGSPLDAVCEVAARVERYDLSLLVLGESGYGKELLARAVHFARPRSGAAFVVENCAAIPDTLLESELFGHKRGAFTGAYDDHPGLFQRASGGTVFLDEIGETSPAFQVRLLRVLQEREVRPVGAARSFCWSCRWRERPPRLRARV